MFYSTENTFGNISYSNKDRISYLLAIDKNDTSSDIQLETTMTTQTNKSIKKNKSRLASNLFLLVSSFIISATFARRQYKKAND